MLLLVSSRPMLREGDESRSLVPKTIQATVLGIVRMEMVSEKGTVPPPAQWRRMTMVFVIVLHIKIASEYTSPTISSTGSGAIDSAVCGKMRLLQMMKWTPSAPSPTCG
jgi:hypothetical protein